MLSLSYFKKELEIPFSEPCTLASMTVQIKNFTAALCTVYIAKLKNKYGIRRT